MPAGSTYTPIATTTLGSAAATYTFTSIPSTYTDLVLVIVGGLNAADNCYIQFNSDTGTNYSYTYLFGSGSAASSSRGSSTANPIINYIGTGQSTTIVNIQNYSNTTTFKTAISRGSDAGLGAMASVVLYRVTSAISSITLKAAVSGTFNSGTTFTLYGIASA